MSIILPRPNEKIKASLINPRILLLYGPPKIGKTTIAANLPDSLLLDLEDGSVFVDAVKIKVESLEHLNIIGGEILKQGRPYKHIILDTATELEIWCENDATQMYKNSIVGKNFKGQSVLELAKGSGYLWLRLSYGKYIKALSSLADRFIIIAHVRDTMIVDKTGREVESKDLDLTGKLKSITCSKADAVGYLYRKSTGEIKDKKPVTELRVNWQGSETVAMGRCKHLINTDFVFDWNSIYLNEEI